MNNLEEIILLINIINTDPSLSLYLSMMPCFNLKFASTNYEFTKYFLLSKGVGMISAEIGLKNRQIINETYSFRCFLIL
jgi:hypothetical protein